MVVLLKKKYFVIVSGAFDRDPVIFDKKPTEEDIKKAIVNKKGDSAKVEERFVLGEDK